MSCCVPAILAAEKIDAHNAKDEPENKTDDQHVQDGRYCLNQRVHHHLL